MLLLRLSISSYTLRMVGLASARASPDRSTTLIAGFLIIGKVVCVVLSSILRLSPLLEETRLELTEVA